MKPIIAGLACVLALSGCTSDGTPTPTAFAPSQEQVVFAAGHWQLTARQVAADFKDRTPEGVVVVAAATGSQFERTFAALLTSEFSQADVALDVKDAPTVTFATELVAPGPMSEIALTVALSKGGARIEQKSYVFYVKARDLSKFIVPSATVGVHSVAVRGER